jgi:hypothetical protein
MQAACDFDAMENPQDHAAYLQHLVVCPVRRPFWVRDIDYSLQILAKLHCEVEWSTLPEDTSSCMPVVLRLMFFNAF